MECGEGIEERHTQQQHSVPGHAERGEEEGFTSSRWQAGDAVQGHAERGEEEEFTRCEAGAEEIRQLREQVSVRYW